MPGGLLVNAVNQVHGALAVMAFEFRFYPDGEKFRSQIALLDLVQVDVAFGYRRVLAEIEVLIQEALRGVSVGIYYEGRLVDGRNGISLRPRCMRGPGSFFMRSWMLCEC